MKENDISLPDIQADNVFGGHRGRTLLRRGLLRFCALYGVSIAVFCLSVVWLTEGELAYVCTSLGIVFIALRYAWKTLRTIDAHHQALRSYAKYQSAQLVQCHSVRHRKSL